MKRTVILLILILVWAAVLIPNHLANRSVARPADSISAFRTQLSVLGRTSPVTGSGPRRSTGPGGVLATRRRRRRTAFVGLLGAAATTFVLGFVPGLGVVHLVHLACDVLLGGYVVWLVRLRSLAESRVATVRHLHPRRPPGAPGGSAHPVFWLERTSA